jgi:hypothetical protein
LADHFFSPLGAPKWPRQKIFAKRDHEQKETPPGCKPYGLEAKETKIVGLVGKKLCSLGYLLFRVCWGARSSHTRRRLSSLKTTRDAKIHIKARCPLFLALLRCLPAVAGVKRITSRPDVIFHQSGRLKNLRKPR